MCADTSHSSDSLLSAGVDARIKTRDAGWLIEGLARGLAIFLGGFSLLNLSGEWRHPRFDSNHWWIAAHMLPRWFSLILLGVGGALMLAWGIQPRCRAWRRWLTPPPVAVLCLLTATDVIGFYQLWREGRIHAGFPLPFSLFVFLAVGIIIATTMRPVSQNRRASTFLAGLIFVVALILFPLAQMFCFGKTDYRRPVDAVVVFGARTYADGRPSDALKDRVRTVVDLYKQGLTRTLVFSGGPGDGNVHETEAMRRMAVELGVPEDAILLDSLGVNTDATVANTSKMLSANGLTRVSAVSHFYHLPRVKLAYQRAGIEIYIVPARETYVLKAMPLFIAREVVALWVYHLRPLWAQ